MVIEELHKFDVACPPEFNFNAIINDFAGAYYATGFRPVDNGIFETSVLTPDELAKSFARITGLSEKSQKQRVPVFERAEESLRLVCPFLFEPLDGVDVALQSTREELLSYFT